MLHNGGVKSGAPNCGRRGAQVPAVQPPLRETASDPAELLFCLSARDMGMVRVPCPSTGEDRSADKNNTTAAVLRTCVAVARGIGAGRSSS